MKFDHKEDPFAVFRSLNLTDEQVEALRTQGFVSRERRGENRIYFKLRFRFQGRQLVRCLGAKAALVRRVEQALAKIQAQRKRRAQLTNAARRSRQTLRLTRLLLAPLLQAAGFQFHGLAVRKIRSGRTNCSLRRKKMNPSEHPSDDVPQIAAEETCPAAEASPTDCRQQRIRDYLHQSLAETSPLRANLGAANADLMTVALHLKGLLEGALPKTLEVFEDFEDFDQVKPVLDSLLRMYKQMERFAQLDARLSEPLP
ncbi:hypothetical protein [Lignipirellula cremea]|uniref:Uncharacterized protein n=1 Tax=Lignipirellula cremea TaxID=2528010 RepID=A0A518DKY3_9BACT|nr:hypothetical protein [Lignipirellula cremea]QDU92497.1 hypothetical protein Pla8534_02450 [Lignipirellula cremea]